MTWDGKLSKRSRSFSFTINNYTADDIACLKAINYRYIIFGKEVGKSGTPHLQCMVLFLNPITFMSMKKQLKRAHIEFTRNDNASMEYCKKEGDFFEDGIPPKQGQRTDIEEVKEILQDGGNMRDVIEKVNSYQSIKYAEIRMKYFEKARNWKPFVEWHYGKTGTGKSKYAFDFVADKDAYTAMSTGKWFEGYDGHEYVLIDDIRQDFMKFHELLRLLDRYEMRVECKGGSRQFLAKHIIITSPFHPAKLFKTDERVNQLIRRIDKIISYPDKTCPSTHELRDLRKELQNESESDMESQSEDEA